MAMVDRFKVQLCFLYQPTIAYSIFKHMLVKTSLKFIYSLNYLCFKHLKSKKEIDSVSPQLGSKIGATQIIISGQFLYNDIQVPAQIEVGGQPCQIIEFNMANLPSTQLKCLNTPEINPILNEYYGNRGINLIIDNVFTPFIGLATAIPSGTAQTTINNRAAFFSNQTNNLTVWMIGYFNPKITSIYEFNIVTNGNAILLISNDSTSANKVRYFKHFISQYLHLNRNKK
jgi:hypothetical protein